MLFVAKSSPHKSELEERKNKGFNLIEIQLLSDVTDEDYYNIINVNNIDVLNVHSPLINTNGKNEDVALENLANEKEKKLFISTCELSQKLAEYYKHDINIIVHNSFSSDQYQKTQLILEYLKDLFTCIIKKYPNINFLIENVTPLTKNNKYRNGVYLEDIFYIVNELNKINPGKFGITFDTCHMMTTKIYYEKILYNNELLKDKNYKTQEFSYDYIFSNYADIIKNIHLNNISGHGSTKETHGTGFTKKDYDFLKTFFDCYKLYKCDALITLEIREEDYYNCKNLYESYKVIQEILKEE